MSGRGMEQLVLFQSFWAGSIFLMRNRENDFLILPCVFSWLTHQNSNSGPTKEYRGPPMQWYSHAFASLAGSSKTGSRREKLAKALSSFYADYPFK